ncbi:hypothetical protein QWZ16_23310 [Vibrio ostreicida]|uniref:Uncharacterized protein n=1 Tax=Vibrio ostreicida TaxID=526588 RepID=A0ABT8C1P1_9VIBR|nr:hypothetical protein [Vibrio ostreicida]MDN3612531.1 hypothetical protein [Vibrio ostreicida]
MPHSPAFLIHRITLTKAYADCRQENPYNDAQLQQNIDRGQARWRVSR